MAYIRTPQGAYFEKSQQGLRAINDPTVLRSLSLGLTPYESISDVYSQTYAPSIYDSTPGPGGMPPPPKPGKIDLTQFDSNDPLRKFNLALLDMLKKAQSGETKFGMEKAQLEKEAYESGQEVFTGEEAKMTPEAKMAALNRNVAMYEPSVQAATTRIKQLGDTIDLLKTTYGEDFSKLIPATEKEAATIKNALKAGITIDASLLQRYSKYLTEDDFVAYAEAKKGKEKLDTQIKEVGGREILYNMQTGEAIKDLGAATTGAGLTPAQINQTVNQIAGAFDNEPIVKEYNTISGQINFIKGVGTSPTDDIGRVYAFAKIMDPNSVVREGEYKTVQDYSTALMERFGLKAKRVFENTGFLTTEARDFMTKTLESKLKASEAQYNQVRSEYQRQMDDAYKGLPRNLTEYKTTNEINTSQDLVDTITANMDKYENREKLLEAMKPVFPELTTDQIMAAIMGYWSDK